MEFDPEQTLQPSDNPGLRGKSTPTQIGRYAILRHIGDGGMGRVYLAQHTGIDREVALKLLPKAASRNPDDIRRFRTEAKTLAKLDHPNIVRVYDFDEADGECFLGMEFVDGGDLLDRIKGASEGIPAEETGKVLEELLDSLVYAHAAGVIHRDLKPANILLSKDGTIKVSDFGLAAVVGEDYHKSLIEKSITLSRVANMETMQLDEGSSASAFAGTLLYMSPEAIQGGRPDRRDDLYAVGVIAYYMLTGKQPGVNYKPPSRVVKGLNRKWDRFIAKCLETSDLRYQSADEALAALRAFLRPRRASAVRWVLPLVLAGAGGAAYWQWEALEPHWVQLKEVVQGWTGSPSTDPGTSSGSDPAPTVDNPGTTVAPPRAVVPSARTIPVSGTPRQVNLTARAGSEVIFQRALMLPTSIDLPTDRGDLALEFTAEGHAPQRFDIRAGEALSSLPVNLAALIAQRSFQFRSNVAGAEVWVDGVPVGTTEAAVELTFERASKNTPWSVLEATLRAPDHDPAVVTIGYEDPEILPQVNLVAQSADLTVKLPDGYEILFKPIEPGTFAMGSPDGEFGRNFDENLRTAEIEKRFYIAQTEVTQGQYRAIMGRNPSANRFGSGASRRPVEQVTFADLTESGGFLDRFNAYLAANGYEQWRADLPTEAQWEYAARAGTRTALSNGMNLDVGAREDVLAGIGVVARDSTDRVAQLEPNPWGLYDMHGNVWEWTREGVLRGGSFQEGPTLARSASRLRGQRDNRSPDKRFGFRLILTRVD